MTTYLYLCVSHVGHQDENGCRCQRRVRTRGRKRLRGGKSVTGAESVASQVACAVLCACAVVGAVSGVNAGDECFKLFLTGLMALAPSLACTGPKTRCLTCHGQMASYKGTQGILFVHCNFGSSLLLISPCVHTQAAFLPHSACASRPAYALVSQRII